MTTSKQHSSGTVLSAVLVLLLVGLPIMPAHAAPTLGTASDFAVLGGSAVTNTGPTVLVGSLGVSPGSAISGFPPGIVTAGITHAADAVAMQAQNDVTTAYNAVAGTACTSDLTGTDLGGLTLTAGVYCFSTSAQLTGTLTLDAAGDPNALFLFKIGSTLTSASGSNVVMINGGATCNVFWQVGSSATLGTGSTFVGNVLALSSVTLTTGTSLSGRSLARNGAITLDTNQISACTAPPVVVGGGGGTSAIPASSWWSLLAMSSLLLLLVTKALRRATAPARSATGPTRR